MSDLERLNEIADFANVVKDRVMTISIQFIQTKFQHAPYPVGQTSFHALNSGEVHIFSALMVSWRKRTCLAAKY